MRAAKPVKAAGAARAHRARPQRRSSRTPARAARRADPRWRVLCGDCLELLPELSEDSVDAVVCDPPYGINFKGQRWDGRAIRDSAATTTGRGRLGTSGAFQEWARSWASECLRVLKPGAHLLALGSPRTFHRLAAGIEDAGLELRDTLMWVYGSGMAKSRRLPGGRGTALKPAWEPIVLARKPPDGTIEHNLRRHGVGALNIEACRIHERWPANVLLGHDQRCTADRCTAVCALEMIDRADRRSSAGSAACTPPSRLFFSSKVSRTERDAGCERLPPQDLNLFPNAQGSGRPPLATRNPHPTVKPIALMRWLVRLACPPGGLVLDPFCGSGTTGAAALIEHRRFLGIERETAYTKIARTRIAHGAPTTGRHRKEQTGDPLATPTRRAA